MDEQRVKGLLAEYAQAMKSTALEVAEREAEISRLQAEIRSLQEQARIPELQVEILSVAARLGKAVKGDGASVTYRSGYTRVTWDTGILNGAINVWRHTNPDLAEVITSAQKTSYTAPSVKIVLDRAE